VPAISSVRQLRLKGLRDPLLFRLGSTDILVIEEIFLKGEYDCVLNSDLKDPALIVDLGANSGYSVRLWSQKYTTGRIIAVEPDPENARMCRMNCRLGKCLDRVDVIPAFVGGREGKATLINSGSEWSYTMSKGAESGKQSIDVMTIPQILAQVGAKGCIDLLKCDIEGTERELFEHAHDWLRRVRNIVVELHAPYELGHLKQQLADAGASFRIVARNKTNTLVFLHQQ
jgi:FkbM family methyltransferase